MAERRELQGFSPPEPKKQLSKPVVAFTGLVLTVFAAACAAGNTEENHIPCLDPSGKFIGNELIVQPKGGEITPDVQEIFDEFDAEPIPGRILPDGTVLVAVDPEKRDKLEAVLDDNPHVESAEKYSLLEPQLPNCPSPTAPANES